MIVFKVVMLFFQYSFFPDCGENPRTLTHKNTRMYKGRIHDFGKWRGGGGVPGNC